MTEEEKKAIYDAVIDGTIALTRKAKAAGFSAETVWENTKYALVKMFGCPEEVAAFLIREAWKKAATEA